MKKYKDFTKEEKEIADKIIGERAPTILAGGFIAACFGAAFGLGVGLIFLRFLQAVGLSIVSGSVVGFFGLMYTLYGPVLTDIRKAIDESE